MRNIGFSKIFCHHIVTSVPLGYPPKLGLELVCSTELIIRGPLFRGEITPKSFTSPRAPFRAFTEETIIFHEISLAFTGSFLILVNICAPKARLSPGGVDSDCHCAEQLLPVSLGFAPPTGPIVWASWSRCLLPPDLASLWVP